MLFIFEIMVTRDDRLNINKEFRFDDENFVNMGIWSISLTIVNIVTVWREFKIYVIVIYAILMNISDVVCFLNHPS